ncbi:DUF2061 domain-containing protein [Candidatus Woesearchaeota archaeon]|nr:MAG: DUF2061 domain-containing protein [Candidatus Woesearchaeota archaeon]
MNERKRRSLAKAISWRIVASLTTMVLVWVFTGNLIISFGVGLTEAIVKMALYFAHERAWNSIKWGVR